jgi:hypothetical protein
MDAPTIVNEIVAHVGNDARSKWYAGIAADPQDALFNRHCVDREHGGWIYRRADSNKAARAAEDALHDVGFDGGPCGGNDETKSVYAYKKTSATSQD